MSLSYRKLKRGWTGSEVCERCGEYHSAALRVVEGGIVCADCLNETGSTHTGTCAFCGKQAPLVGHHIEGRKVSDDTAMICQNCHARQHPKGR
jgi:formylmethanofuran dehydrogenase subunit E